MNAGTTVNLERAHKTAGGIRAARRPLRPRVRGALSLPQVLVAAVAAGIAVVLSAQAPRANLLLVTLDTVRADHLGSYGDKQASTPVLDRLAREGVRFADATSHAPITGPAHAGLLTGVYPARFGIRDNAANPLPPDAGTLAESLKAAGYRTGAFIGAFILDRAYGFDQGFDHFDSRFDRFDSRTKLGAERPAAAVVEPAVKWLGQLPSTQPFFAWIHLFDAHAPYTPPAPFNKTFRDRPYDGEIAAVDRAIGAVIAALESRGLLDRTLVVAIGDHGESLGEHGEDDHGVFLYDSVLRIPWVMRLPARERSGTVVQEQVRAIDLMPTLLELLNVVVPQRLDGESLAAVVRGRTRRDPPPAYAETYYPKLHFGWSELRSVRVGDWKFVDAPRPELYALRTDAAESTNVAGNQGGLASRLNAELAGIAAGWNAAPERQAPAPDRETLERLRSLGYVGFAASSTSAGRGADPKDMVSRLRGFRQLLTGATQDLKEGRPAAAADKLRQALAINDRAYDVHIALGDVYMESRQHEQALGEYEAAALLNPGSADPLLAASSALLAQGKTELATRKIAEAERIEPLSPEIPFAKGRMSEQAGRDAEALAHYGRAVAANPSDSRARARLANMAVRLDKVDLAAEQFTELLAADYQPARTHFGLGWVAEARGDRAAAAREYRRALAIDPGFAAAQRALARLEGKR
jgi:arylsulfatase A-like enzyme/Tfp pilus assembly protein PilF